MKAVVHFDGASLGNPGPMGAGATVQTPAGTQELALPLGVGTNNQAEYQGVILGLRHALAAGADEVKVVGDSQLVLRQLEGKYAVRHPNILPLHREARALLAKFRRVQYEWVPREQNTEADRLSMDAALRAKETATRPG